ncbi:MAG: 3-hydroxyacyl-[acyl-carrier-protein] dehydratase [Acidimicrobiaceae bacterium]|nr:3-hydroxyacyl-[acyl-carrier-protein] dehydratase [Acidimicrobiaceae bacterium]
MAANPVDLLPHRPPFRFVDSVDEVVPGERVVARYRVTGHEAFLPGHFPGNPVFPGVIQLEALAQAGAVAVLSDERFTGRLPLFGGVEKARFRRVVRPGDQLVLTVVMERLSARGGWGQAEAVVAGPDGRGDGRDGSGGGDGGGVSCQARLFFAFAPSP